MFYLRRDDGGARRAASSPEAALEIAAATSGRAVLDLRPDRDDRDGRHVLRRQPDLLVLRRRHDPRRRRRRARLADRPARDALAASARRAGSRRAACPTSPSAATQTKGESRVWGAILDRVLERPVVSVVARRRPARRARASPRSACTRSDPGVAGLLAQPAGHADLRPHPGRVPRRRRPGHDRRQGRRRHRRPRSRPRSTQLHDQALRHRAAVRARHASTISPDKTVADRRASRSKGNGTDAASERSLAALRDEVVPATVGRLAGAEVDVTGMTAGSKDFNDVMKSHLPIVFAFVLGLAFILLLVTFRSIVDPDQGDRAEPAVGRRGLRRARRSSSRTATARGCSASSRSAASRPGCRCSCS